MKTLRIVATSLAILFAAFAVVTLQAQQQQGPPRNAGGGTLSYPNGIAVVDITFILDNYPRLQEMMQVYKKDFEATAENFRKEQNDLMKRGEELKSLKPGSPDYKKLEEQLTKRGSDLKVDAQLKEKEFREREARNYLTAYQEISQQVKLYADRHAISLVLRFNGTTIDPNNREAVQAEVFKTVTYYSKDIDITDQVLAELRAKSPKAPAGRANTATAPPNPRGQRPQ